jgi:hypothetical protein
MVSAVVDSIAAIAVVVSLVYLGIQVRIQNDERRVASVHEISEAYRNTMVLLTEGDMAALLVKGIGGYEALADVEKVRVSAYCMVAFKLFEEAYYQRTRERLDRYIWEGMVRQMEDSLATEVLQTVWQLRRHQFGDDFRAFMDGLSPGRYPL